MPIANIPVSLATLPMLTSSATFGVAGELVPSIPHQDDPFHTKAMHMYPVPELIAGAALTLVGAGAQYLIRRLFRGRPAPETQPKRLPPPAPKEPEYETGKRYTLSSWYLEKVLTRLNTLYDILKTYEMRDEAGFVLGLKQRLNEDLNRLEKAYGGELPEKISFDGAQLRLINRLIKDVEQTTSSVEAAIEETSASNRRDDIKTKIQSLQTAPFVEDFFAFQNFLASLPDQPNQSLKRKNR